MTTYIGYHVSADGEHVGVVEREFVCTWGPRRGLIHSVQVSGMDVVWKRIRIPGILYWSSRKRGDGRWVNRLRPDVRYTLRRS